MASLFPTGQVFPAEFAYLQWRKNIYINLLGQKNIILITTDIKTVEGPGRSHQTEGGHPSRRQSNIPGSDEFPQNSGVAPVESKVNKKNTMCDVFLSRHDCFKPPSNYILEVVDGSEPFPALKSCHGSLTYPDNPWVYVWSDCLFRLPLIQCLSWLSWFWRAQSFTPTPRETATFSVTPAPPSSSIKSHCSMNCWWTQSPPVALSLEQNDAFTQSLAKIHYN